MAEVGRVKLLEDDQSRQGRRAGRLPRALAQLVSKLGNLCMVKVVVGGSANPRRSKWTEPRCQEWCRARGNAAGHQACLQMAAAWAELRQPIARESEQIFTKAECVPVKRRKDGTVARHHETSKGRGGVECAHDCERSTLLRVAHTRGEL